MSIVLKVCFRKSGKEFEVQIIPDEPLLFMMKMGEHFTSYQLDSDESEKLLSFIEMYGGKPKALLKPDFSSPSPVSDVELGLKHPEVDPAVPIYESHKQPENGHKISREELSTRAYHAILKAHLATWEAVKNTDSLVLKSHGVGKKTLDELRLKQAEILQEN